jgi:radical SAM superfamily enzyme YgiQ (UPF0313 family)
MKILFIMPPFERLIGTRLAYFPIGLGYLAACLDKVGFPVAIYNAETPNPNERLSKNTNIASLSGYGNYERSLKHDNHMVWQELKGVLRNFHPDVIGISVTSAKVASARKITSICKDYNPKCLVAWGGPHPTIQPEEVLQYDEVDLIIKGEGETTFLEVIKNLNSGTLNFEQIKGISFKKEGKIFHNQCRPLMENLDDLPFPLRSCLVHPERYLSWDMGVIITSRGCPFNCAFCAAQNIWGRKARYRSIKSVIDEIRRVALDFGTRQVFFWDDTFNLDRKRLTELCEALLASRLGISWRCTARVDLLDDQMLRLMRRAGCNSIDIGIESGSDRILGIINKGLNREKVLRGISMIRRNGVNFNAFFMLGFPDETEEDILETLALMQNKAMGTIILSIFTPYPGTELYQRATDLGLVNRDLDWGLFSHHSPHNHFVKNITPERFLQIVRETSLFVDKHNNSLRVFLRTHRNEVGFYLRNPRIFYNKARQKLKFGLS